MWRRRCLWQAGRRAGGGWHTGAGGNLLRRAQTRDQATCDQPRDRRDQEQRTAQQPPTTTLDTTSVGGDIVPLVSWQQIFLLLSSNIFACMVWRGGSCRLSGCEGCWWQQSNCKYLFVKSRTGAHLMIGIMGWLQRYIVQLCAPLRCGAVPWPTKFLAPF